MVNEWNWRINCHPLRLLGCFLIHSTILCLITWAVILLLSCLLPPIMILKLHTDMFVIPPPSFSIPWYVSFETQGIIHLFIPGT